MLLHANGSGKRHCAIPLATAGSWNEPAETEDGAGIATTTIRLTLKGSAQVARDLPNCIQQVENPPRAVAIQAFSLQFPPQ